MPEGTTLLLALNHFAGAHFGWGSASSAPRQLQLWAFWALFCSCMGPAHLDPALPTLPLQVPKRLDLNQGIHTTAELSGFLDIRDSYIWSMVKKWFDHYLKGIPNDLEFEPKVTMQLSNLPPKRLHFYSWPLKGVHQVQHYLQPRGKGRYGGLRSDVADCTSNASGTGICDMDTITHMRVTHLSAGIPLVGPVCHCTCLRKVSGCWAVNVF